MIRPFERVTDNWKRLSIAVKLTTIVVVLVAISVGTITLLSLDREQRNFRSELEQQAISTLSSVSASSIDHMYFLDIARLREIARSLQLASPIIQLVQFYDAKGRVLATTFITARDTISTESGGSGSSFQPEPFGERVVLGGETVLDWQEDVLVTGNPIMIGNQQLGGVRIDFSTTALQSKLAAVRLQGVLVATVAILVGSLSAILMSRSIAGPIQDMAAVSQAIAHGDLEQRVSVNSQDELAILASNFNEMVVKLNDTIVELRQLNSELDMRVAESTEELRTINRELESFSYSVSHDLRAPLRSINGFSTRLLEKYADHMPNEAQHYLNRVHASSEHMGQLIDDILGLSRVGRSKMRMRPVNLTDIANQIVLEMQAVEPQRCVAFEVLEDLIVVGDKRLLEIVLRNLLGNAWKYSRNCDCATITMGRTYENSMTIYFIRDNGVGFDMLYADKLFDAFQRLHGREYEGTGIGLATVRRIINRHGGEIWADAAVNKGATFFFTLNSEQKETAVGQ